MTTVGLYGSSSSGVVASATGSESTGLYGNNVNFGGTYFEWFIFKESATQPATPTGGSWNFSTTSGTPPTGWTSSPPTNPSNQVWISIALVNSKNASTLSWSVPGVMSNTLYGLPNYVQFNTSYNTALGVGQLGWDGNNTLGLGMAGGNVVQRVGEDLFYYIKATSAITKGQVIMFTGAVGASGVVTGAPAAGVSDGSYIMGIAAESIALNGFGLVQFQGTLKGINTSAFSDGAILWYDPAGTGALTATKPSAPNIKVQVAAVINAGSGGSGSILIRVSAGSVLGGTDSNVLFGTLSNNNMIRYNSTGGYWENIAGPAGAIVGTTDTQTLSNKQFSTNVGVGVTPSSWGSSFKILEISNGPFGTFVGGSNGTFYAGTNNYFDGFDFLYKVTGNATQYIQQTNGRHTWYTSSSGTAGDVITFVQAMQLNENKNLAVAGQISGGYLSNGTNTAAQQLSSYAVVKNTISADTTLTTTVAAAGSRATILIVTSGTTSRTVTFGTGFLSTGTLATGTVSAKTFAVSFVSDGTTMIETGRTVAM